MMNIQFRRTYVQEQLDEHNMQPVGSAQPVCIFSFKARPDAISREQL